MGLDSTPPGGGWQQLASFTHIKEKAALSPGLVVFVQL